MKNLTTLLQIKSPKQKSENKHKQQNLKQQFKPHKQSTIPNKTNTRRNHFNTQTANKHSLQQNNLNNNPTTRTKFTIQVTTKYLNTTNSKPQPKKQTPQPKPNQNKPTQI